MILKLLLIIGVVAIVYFIFFKKKPLQNNTQKDVKNRSDKLDSNEMVECSACGIYTELGDTIISNNKYYCSKECVEKV